MKKLFLNLASLVLIISMWSCSYDDNEIWDKVNNLGERVETLETKVNNMNANITSLKEVVDALNQGKVILSMDEIENGYRLNFSNNQSIDIINGKNGKDAPVVGVKQDEDGVYYWTIDGSFFDPKLAVTGADGKDGITPIIGINDAGNWTIDTGSGVTEFLKDGNPVKAVGKDGDFFFKSVTETDIEVIMTIKDGTIISLPKKELFLFDLENQTENALFTLGETKTYKIDSKNLDDITLIQMPKGWNGEITNNILKVVAPSVVSSGEMKILLTTSNGYSKVVKKMLYTINGFRTLTFEDKDYKGNGNFLGVKDWSSLIDDPQYNGELLYGEDAELYQWNDENNTFLSSGLVTGPYGAAYWSGGHAISNYFETDITKGNFDIQLAVPYSDTKTSKGGHNGSSNFCVHNGYIDDSGFAMNTDLPKLSFKDKNARIIDHMYVIPTTYLLNCEKIGNSFTSKIGPKDWLKITATGYDLSEKVTSTCDFYLAKDGKIVDTWTKWDLSSLGKVYYVKFNIEGTSNNGYGLSQPAYFAYDDVVVAFD